MSKIKSFSAYAAGLLILIAGCGSGLKDGYNSELDQSYDGFDVATYLGEGGSAVGTGEAVEGLLKIARQIPSQKLNIYNFNIVPEDIYVKVISEDRYNQGRLRNIEVELRFTEDSNIKHISIFEAYNYSTPGGETQGDLNSTKPYSDGGPYTQVKTNYRRKMVFEKFDIRVEGVRQYNEDPELKDFLFYDKTRGNQDSVSELITQGNFSQGAGNFTRVAYYKNGQIGSDVRNYLKDADGKVTGVISGNSADGIVANGSFEINTGNTTCILDDTGNVDYVLYYPSGHFSERTRETAHFDLLVNGVGDATFNLENADGSAANRAMHRVIARPASCDERVIRNSADLTGNTYDGSLVEVSEVRAREYTHIFGSITDLEGKVAKVEQYRVSGLAVYR